MRNNMSNKYLYEAKGFVVGNLWGGGYGYYPAEKFKNSKKKQLMIDIDLAFRNGTLDSGMGFESLIGAIMEITSWKKIIIKDTEYQGTCPKCTWHTLGTLTKKQEEKLLDELFYRGSLCQ